jgi:dynactin 1
MNLNLQLQSKVLKTTAIAIDQEIAKLNLEQAETQFSFIKDYLPKSSFEADADSLLLSLLLKRFIFKSELVMKHLERYQLGSDNSVDISESELLFYWTVSLKFIQY